MFPRIFSVLWLFLLSSSNASFTCSTVFVLYVVLFSFESSLTTVAYDAISNLVYSFQYKRLHSLQVNSCTWLNCYLKKSLLDYKIDYLFKQDNIRKRNIVLFELSENYTLYPSNMLFYGQIHDSLNILWCQKSWDKWLVWYIQFTVIYKKSLYKKLTDYVP